MKAKTYDRWINKPVRRTTDRKIGRIAEPYANTWWLVEWTDGSRTHVPQRLLDVIDEATWAEAVAVRAAG